MTAPVNQEQFEKGIELAIPSKLGFLYQIAARFKIVYGGRGGGKTESIARILLALASMKRLRIACFREFQNSIDESVYATLVNCIYDLWPEGSWVFEWDIQKTTIISKRTGSEFVFSGLRYKIESIKSMARIDIAWLEEARNASKTTLDKLFPTIRGVWKEDELDRGGPFGKGPEIWISFNPELEGDEIYKRSVKEKDKYFPDFVPNKNGEMERYAIVVKLNYHDNPMLPEDLRQQMEVARQASLKDPDDTEYLEVWEGHTKTVLKGAIYAKEIKKILKDGRRGRVPYNANKPVKTFWDLGHRDKTAIWFVQHAGVGEFNLIHYYENCLEKMPHYIEYLQQTQYLFDQHVLPHDGDDETLSNISPKNQLKKAFPNCKIRIVDRPSKKMIGINAARTVMDLCNFDEDGTAEGWACLCNYAYKVDEDNGVFSKEPEHDTPWSHGADAFQTFALSLKPEQEQKKPVKVVSINKPNLRGGNSWMGV